MRSEFTIDKNLLSVSCYITTSACRNLKIKSSLTMLNLVTIYFSISRLAGSYEALDAGSSADALSDLTGGVR